MIEGDVTVDDIFKLAGMIVGNVTVEEGAHFTLYGTVTNNILIKKGGECNIFGTVAGNVINEGGIVNVSGVVRGCVTGNVEIAPNARVGHRAE